MSTLAQVTPIDEGKILLHIGPQKTGSTAIQEALHTARDDLAAQGVYYPEGRRPVEAGWALLGKPAPLGRPQPQIARWHDLIARLDEAGLPRAIISNEDLSLGDDEAVDRIVESLGADRLQVVYVGRRYDGLLPSHWQERLKARMVWSYPHFLEHVLGEEKDTWEWNLMWDCQLPARILARWGRHLRPDQFTLVALEQGNHDYLPRVFERLLGLREHTLHTPRSLNNRSYTFPEAETLRAVNAATLDLTHPDYLRLVRKGVARRWTDSDLPAGHDRIPGLPDWAVQRVADLADIHADAFAGSGAQLVGDPDWLRVRGRIEAHPGPFELSQVPASLAGEAVAVTSRRVEEVLRPAAPEPTARALAGLLRRKAQRRVRRLVRR